ncbi:MAG: SDR family NAD(P)-dependent oxidoreductase [Saprospiraceae bacterium]
MKNILITGSTDGIGKLTAIKLAKDGHTVFLHGRNSKKLSEVINEIKSTSNNENIKGFVADFSDLDAVKKMAQEVKNEIPSLDVLINNAGVFKSSVAANKDGIDLRLVVNYLAPYLLTRELISLLDQAKAPRLINLSSAAQAPVTYEALVKKSNLSEQASYAQSKLALTMWSFYLAEKLPNINTIAVNPGSLLNTNMVKEAYGKFWSSADKGANILYDLAVDEKYKNDSGKYFDNDRGSFGEAHADAYEETAINQLIKTTDGFLEK